MTTVKLDMKDPATKAVVDGWADNTEYVIRTGAGPNRATAEVVDTEESDTEGEGEAPGAPEAGAGGPGPAAVKAAMAGPMMGR